MLNITNQTDLNLVETQLNLLCEGILATPSPAALFTPRSGFRHNTELDCLAAKYQIPPLTLLTEAINVIEANANGNAVPSVLELKLPTAQGYVTIAIKMVNLAIDQSSFAIYLAEQDLVTEQPDSALVDELFRQSGMLGYSLHIGIDGYSSSKVYGSSLDLLVIPSEVFADKLNYYLYTFPEIRTLIASPSGGSLSLDYLVEVGPPTKWVRNIVTVVRSEKSVTVSGVISDITEQKETEAELHDLLETSHDGLWQIELDEASQAWKLVSVNEALTAMLGLNLEDIISLEDMQELVHADDRQHFVQALQALINKEATDLVVEVRIRKGTDYIPVELQVNNVVHSETGAMRLLGSIRDVSERKKATELEGALHTFMEQSTDAVMITDQDQNILFANQATLNIFRYFMPDLTMKELETMLEVPTGSLTLPQGVVEMRRLFRSILNSRTDVREQHSVDFGNNIKRTYDVIATTGEYHGKPAFFLSLRDVTDMLRQAKERDELIRAVERQNALEIARRQGIAAVVHSFRTPLAIISTNNYLLGRTTPDKHPERVAVIGQQVEALKRMMEDILTVSRNAAGKVHINPQQTNMQEVIEKLVRDHIKVAEGGLHRIESIVHPGDYEIVCDPERVWDVVDNLMSNARKYSPEGGIIRSEMWREPNYVCIKVTDEGIGMTAEDMQYIFEPFYRTDAAEQVTRGTGVGLWTVKMILDAVGGSVHCESEVGKGSKFIVKFPTSTALEA